MTLIRRMQFPLPEDLDIFLLLIFKNALCIQYFANSTQAAMEDDFNTADAVSSVFELVKFINTKVSSESSRAFLEKLSDLLRFYH